MPTYEVTDSKTGRKVRLTGDSPPTDAELEQIFAGLPAKAESPKPELPLATRAALAFSQPGAAEQGGTEALLSMGTGALSMIPAGIAGLAGTMLPGPEGQGAKWTENTQRALTYQPRSDAGKVTAELVAKPLEMLDRGITDFAAQNPAPNVAPPPDYRPLGEAAAADEERYRAAQNQSPLKSALMKTGIEGATMLLGPKGKPSAPAPKPTTAASQIIAEGEKHGVPVFFDDVTKSAVAKRVGVTAEPLGSLGTGAGRAKQAEAAKSAAESVVQSRVPSIGDDVPVLVQKGLKTKLDQFRKTSKVLYERTAAALDPLGAVPRPGFDSVIQNAKQEMARRGTLANENVVNLLDKYEQAPRGDFSLTREMRSQLSEDISDFYTGANTAIGEKGVTILQGMKTALDADLGSFAKNAGGQGYANWKMADGHYKTNIVPFKEAGFRDLVKTAEPEKAWRYLLAQGSLKSRSVRMYNSLDDSGRAAVRYGLVKDALDSAINPNETFSPAKFAKYLEDHESAVKTFFKGGDLREIEGFRNLMRHIERAGQFAENPPTGQRLIPWLLGGAAATGPLGLKAAAVAGTAGVSVRALFQTKTGRNLLLGLSRAPQGSQAARVLSQRAVRLMAVSAVAKSGDEETNGTALQQEKRQSAQ